MSLAPTETTRTEVQIGLVVEDQRTGDLRLIVYADDRVVLARDETGSTTLTPREAFDSELATRYRARPDADPDVDAGQYGRLRERLAEYDERDGRKAEHKADALREALDLLADRGEGDDSSAEADDDAEVDDPEARFEDVPGVGPETAANIRTQGFLTESDVRAASDEGLLAVSGVGPDTVENIREFVARGERP